MLEMTTFDVLSVAAVSRCFSKKGVLKHFAKFTVKHLCWSLFLIKLQTLGQQFIEKGAPT